MSALARSASSAQTSGESTFELANSKQAALRLALLYLTILTRGKMSTTSLDSICRTGFAVDDSSSAMGMAVAKKPYLGTLIAASAVGIW